MSYKKEIPIPHICPWLVSRPLATLFNSQTETSVFIQNSTCKRANVGAGSIQHGLLGVGRKNVTPCVGLQRRVYGELPETFPYLIF